MPRLLSSTLALLAIMLSFLGACAPVPPRLPASAGSIQLDRAKVFPPEDQYAADELGRMPSSSGKLIFLSDLKRRIALWDCTTGNVQQLAVAALPYQTIDGGKTAWAVVDNSKAEVRDYDNRLLWSARVDGTITDIAIASDAQSVTLIIGPDFNPPRSCVVRSNGTRSALVQLRDSVFLSSADTLLYVKQNELVLVNPQGNHPSRSFSISSSWTTAAAADRQSDQVVFATSSNVGFGERSSTIECRTFESPAISLFRLPVPADRKDRGTSDNTVLGLTFDPAAQIILYRTPSRIGLVQTVAPFYWSDIASASANPSPRPRLPKIGPAKWVTIDEAGHLTVVSLSPPEATP